MRICAAAISGAECDGFRIEAIKAVPKTVANPIFPVHAMAEVMK
jgi:hypothetical protein